ncbi:MAG: beta-hydroxyacyl-ACP dehydratase [Opitutales bacterium]|nr:beta-hydroxyacyl-ACP dehydratase [Opitutales bacterium]
MDEIKRLIPHRPPFLFVDKILEVTEDGAKASLSVSGDMPFFKGHYPGNPIMPGVLLSESVFQTGAIYLSKQVIGADELNNDAVTPVLSRIRDARFKRMVKPGDELVISVFMVDKVGHFFNLRGEVSNGDKTVMTVSFALALVK